MTLKMKISDLKIIAVSLVITFFSVFGIFYFVWVVDNNRVDRLETEKKILILKSIELNLNLQQENLKIRDKISKFLKEHKGATKYFMPKKEKR